MLRLHNKAPMIKVFYTFFFFFILTNISIAQKVKIKKILDSNLFELTDGRLIKLAGVDVPNINHKNVNLQEVGIDAFKYAKQNLLGQKYNLTFPKNNLLDTNYSLVYIIKEYPLITRNYTKEYLEKGFGKFIVNTEIIENYKYLVAERCAKINKDGIWEFADNYNNDTLDQTFCGAELLTDDAVDSVAIYPLSKPFMINATPTERVFLEIIAAPLVGIPSAFFGGFAGVAIGSLAGAKGWGIFGYAILGSSIGYTVGTAAGVFFVAKNGERDITLGYTILSSFIGAVSGIAIAVSANGIWDGDIYSYAPVILPGVASIIYANFIAPRSEIKGNISQTNFNNFILRNRNLTHKDLYNSTKLLEVNLFRINF